LGGTVRSVNSRSLSPIRPAQLLLVVVAALVLGLVGRPALAGATPAPNQTQLTLDPLVFAGLKVADVKLGAKGSAAVAGGGNLYFPVVNANNVTDAFVGTVKHQGGFEFKIAKTIKIGFRNLTLKTKATSPVTGQLTAEPVVQGFGLGFQIPVSSVTLDSVVIKGGLQIAKYRLRLDPTFTTLINKSLGLTLIKPSQPWGTVETRLPHTAAVTPTTPVATTPPVAANQ
jgi:hypothetical protein